MHGIPRSQAHSACLHAALPTGAAGSIHALDSRQLRPVPPPCCSSPAPDPLLQQDRGDYVAITNECGGTVTFTADYYLDSAFPEDYSQCSNDYAQDSKRCVETLFWVRGGTAYSTWPTSGAVYIRASELVPTGNGLGSNNRAVPLNGLEEAQLADGSSGYKASDPLAQPVSACTYRRTGFTCDYNCITC